MWKNKTYENSKDNSKKAKHDQVQKKKKKASIMKIMKAVECWFLNRQEDQAMEVEIQPQKSQPVVEGDLIGGYTQWTTLESGPFTLSWVSALLRQALKWERRHGMLWGPLDWINSNPLILEMTQLKFRDGKRRAPFSIAIGGEVTFQSISQYSSYWWYTPDTW